MTEKEFAVIIRRALLLIVSAIEKRYKLGKHSEAETQEVSERDNTTY